MKRLKSALAIEASSALLFAAPGFSQEQQPQATQAQAQTQPQKPPMTEDEVFYAVANSLMQKTGENGIVKVETDINNRLIRLFVKVNEPAPAMKPDDFRLKVLEETRKNANLVRAFEVGKFTLETNVSFSDGKSFVVAVSAKDLAQTPAPAAAAQ